MSKISIFFKYLFRIVPAIVFIFSGIVKAIDPVGFAIKIEDYLLAFNLNFLDFLAFPAAVIVIAVEFLLGIYLLFNIFPRLVAPILLIFTLFFTLLTLYSLIFNPVSDCGCFGDAIKLTNLQTFVKNIILTFFVLGFFIWRKTYRTRYSVGYKLIAGLAPIVFIIMFAMWNYNHLPIIDFRPYKIGTNIADNMIIPADKEQPVYETVFVMEKDGKQQTFDLNNYPYTDSTWVFVDTKTTIIKEGYTPPLQTFSVTNVEGEDITQDFTHHEKSLFVIVSYDISKIDKTKFKKTYDLALEAQTHEIPFVVLTSSDETAISKFESEFPNVFQYNQCDETTLKTIIRSNYGLLLIYDGTIIGKWHNNDIPDSAIINNPVAYSTDYIYSGKRNQYLFWFLTIFCVTLIVVSSFKEKKI